jgi:YkoY family integral membrane protein
MIGYADTLVILSIICLEGLLSVDNALVNASLACKLPAKEQKKAIRFGIGAGAVLRLVALFCASLVIQYPAIKLLGAGYLVYLMVKHLWFDHKTDVAGKHHAVKAKLFDAVVSIALADIAFSLDNVVAAIGMSPKFSVVVIGVIAGIVTMMFATQLVVILIGRYPKLEKTAYVIVGYIGTSIFAEELFHIAVPEMAKFTAIIGMVVGTIIYEELKKKVHAKRQVSLGKLAES